MARNGSINVFTWKQCEIDGAWNLGAIVGIVLRQAAELAKINRVRTQQQRTRCFCLHFP